MSLALEKTLWTDAPVRTSGREGVVELRLAQRHMPQMPRSAAFAWRWDFR